MAVKTERIIKEIKKRLLLDRYFRFDYRIMLFREEYKLNYGQIILLSGLLAMSKKKNPVVFGDDYIIWCLHITQRTYDDWMRGLKDAGFIDYEFIRGRNKSDREIFVMREKIMEMMKTLDVKYNLDPEKDEELIDWYKNYGADISSY